MLSDLLFFSMYVFCIFLVFFIIVVYCFANIWYFYILGIFVSMMHLLWIPLTHSERLSLECGRERGAHSASYGTELSMRATRPARGAALPLLLSGISAISCIYLFSVVRLYIVF